MNELELPDVKDVALWLGELQLNLKMSQKKIKFLTDENIRLNQELLKLSNCKKEKEADNDQNK